MNPPNSPHPTTQNLHSTNLKDRPIWIRKPESFYELQATDSVDFSTCVAFLVWQVCPSFTIVDLLEAFDNVICVSLDLVSTSFSIKSGLFNLQII